MKEYKVSKLYNRPAVRISAVPPNDEVAVYDECQTKITMKRIGLWVLTLSIIASFSPHALGQSCSTLYSYADMWLDATSQGIALNYTSADVSCGDYTAYAEVTISVLNGASVTSTSYDNCCAEAVTATDLSFDGSGELSAYSEVNYACYSPVSYSSGSAIDFGTSRWKVQTLRTVGQIVDENWGDGVECDVTSWCSNTTAPFGFQSTVKDFLNHASCDPYYVCSGAWLSVFTDSIFYWRDCTGTIATAKPVCSTGPHR